MPGGLCIGKGCVKVFSCFGKKAALSAALFAWRKGRGREMTEDMEKGSAYHISEEHAAGSPLTESRDHGKGAFGSAFGAEQRADDAESVRAYLIKEWEEAVGDTPEDAAPVAWEDIGGGLCRFCLSACPSRSGAELLADLFLLTVRGRVGQRGREAYRPHYRLLRKEYAGYFPALLKVRGILEEKGRAVVAIDGRCAGGKTHFAALIGRLFPCNVFHMDDFYLPMDMRPSDWTRIPGGNMDLVRFRTEVLAPAKAGESVTYRPYDCRKGEGGEARLLPYKPLTVVEGSYSHHPALADGYDLRIFLTCSRQEQTSRLHMREGGRFSAYEEMWVPMEENYFRYYAVEAGSDLVVDTTSFFG